jgi:putative oxidoreductase
MENKPKQSSLAVGAYKLLITVAASLQPLVLLVLRLYWGWQFFGDGRGKLQNLDKVTSYFGHDLHIPFPHLNALLASGVECAGGLLLLIGLGSRLVCIPLVFTMVIAYLTAEKEALNHIFSAPDKFVTADPFLYLLASIIILVFGPGVFSVDGLLARKYRDKKS